MFATDKLDVPCTLKVPVKNAFTVLRAFDTYKFPAILADAFVRVMVFAVMVTPEMVFDPASVPYRVVPTIEDPDTVFDPARFPYR